MPDSGRRPAARHAGASVTTAYDDPVTLTPPAPALGGIEDPVTARRIMLRRRLLGPGDPERLWGWAAIALIAAIGGLIRFIHLGRPNYLVFDETYYVKQGASMLKFGYERATALEGAEADKLWNTGNTDVWTNTPDFVVHPPVGKWMIAMGEGLFGVNSSFGWRFASAVVGTLSILMLGRIARRMFRSTLVGATAALLLAVDGQHFVHSRTGLLDVFVMFWALAAFGALVIDRDAARVALAARMARAPDAATGYGPGIGIRWWRVVAGICLGLCIGTKWSGLWFAAAFGLMTVLWDVGARRAAGTKHWLVTGLFRDGAVAGLQMLPIAVVVYVSSWAGWFASSDAYNRNWAQDNPAHGLARVVPGALRSLWNYHQQMWQFNTGLRTPHSYQSHPYSWLVLGRPTSFDYRSFQPGEGGCKGTGECVTAITDLGNPVIWWGATLALTVVIAMWAFARDWRAGAILAGLIGGLLPWFLFAERTIYTFYAVAVVPYVVLALTYVLALVLGRARTDPDRRLVGAAAAGGVVVLAVLAFAWFYPVLSDELIKHADWVNRMWLPSWI